MKARNPSLLYVTTVPYTLRAFLLPYGDHFRAQGWKVAAAASGGAPEEGTITDRTWDMATRAAFHEHYDLDLHRGLRGVPGIYRAGSRLRDLVMHGGFDLVHVHTPIAGVAARMGLRRLRSAGGARVIYTAHGFHFHAGRSRLQNLPWETVERVCARWTDRLVVMNEEDHIAATSWGTIEPNRVVRMPGIGVDLARYGRNRSREAAVDGNIPHDDRVVLMLGELRRNKRVADALMALRRLDGLQITLCIAGEGPELGPLKALARRLEIADQVRFLGFRNDVPTLLARADALVFCTEREGLPRSVMEAMAAGVPIVATDIRGNRDLLAPIGGLLYPVGDIEALAGGIRKVLTDEKLAQRLSENGRRAVTQYELGHVLSLHEELYAEVLAESAG